MKQHYILFFSKLLFFSILFSGCNLYNPAEPVPSYIHIDKIDLVTTEIQGSNSSKITDAWVYIDEKLIGCFELPATIPVLYEGNHQVAIKAGIKVNGIAATRAPYPFYERFVQSTDLTRGSISTIKPIVTYVSNLNWDNAVIWQENFESGISVTASPFGTDTLMKRITTSENPLLVFEGNAAGVAYINSTKTIFECVSSNSYILPRGDSPSFLELNYKCNYLFVVGLVAHGPSGSIRYKVLNINPSLNWNKIYIYLNPIISSSGASTDFSVFMGMLNNTGSNDAYLAIDNLKLVHY